MRQSNHQSYHDNSWPLLPKLNIMNDERWLTTVRRLIGSRLCSYSKFRWKQLVARHFSSALFGRQNEEGCFFHANNSIVCVKDTTDHDLNLNWLLQTVEKYDLPLHKNRLIFTNTVVLFWVATYLLGWSPRTLNVLTLIWSCMLYGKPVKGFRVVLM